MATPLPIAGSFDDDLVAGVGLHPLSAEPLTVASYLAARASAGVGIATMRLATSAISKAHEWARLERPAGTWACRLSEGMRTGLSRPQRQSGALTSVQPRRRSRGTETPDQAAERGKFDVALSDAGRRLTRGTFSVGTPPLASSPWSAPRPTQKP